MTTDFERVRRIADVLGDRYTEDMKTAFPDIDPPYGRPFGYLALLQLRLPLRKTRGGLIIPEETQDFERYRVQAALVRAVGPAAFHDRQNGKPWSEGEWFKEGDFIRAPMYGGDRFDVDLGVGDQRVTFVFMREHDAVAPVVADPLTIKTS